MIDQQQFRDLMSGVCAPVAVVTTTWGGVPRGATVSSLVSVSLDPPLVSVAFDRRSSLLGQITKAGRFGVNVLDHAQDELAAAFARHGADRFASTDWSLDRGLPRLAGGVSWMVCDLHDSVDVGDHVMLIGLVVGASRGPDVAPLVYAYRTFGTHSRFAERPRRRITDLIAACAQ